MKLAGPLLLTCFFFMPTLAQAQEKYSIKFKEPGVGESSRVDIKETITLKTTINIEKQKEPIVQEMKGTKQFVFTQTILERPAGASQPTKVRRAYEKAVNEQKGPFAKPQDPLPFHGKTVLIEKKGDKFEFRLENGKLLDTGIAELQGEFDRNEGDKAKKALIPPGPVALNESWKFDPMAFGGPIGQDEKIKVQKAEGSAKLVKVYKKDGRLFGVIEAVMEIQMSMTFKIGAGDNTDGDSKVTFKLLFDGCIDGQASIGSLRGSGDIGSTSTLKDPQAGNIRNVSSTLVTVENSWQELPKK